jgi:hypothetical protein
MQPKAIPYIVLLLRTLDCQDERRVPVGILCVDVYPWNGKQLSGLVLATFGNKRKD